MPDPQFDTLEVPLIRVRLPGADERDLSLPGVLAQLSSGEVGSFMRLRPHQTHAWHAFLVQLGAIAMHAARCQDPPRDATGWRSLLLELTAGDHAPWCLVVQDMSKPALLQPPVPEGDLKALKNRIESPEGLDILITAKNHDIKAERMVHAQPDHWLYALLTLQTMQGFLGAGNYGIARMNGGFASRACVSIVPGDGWGARFRRDLAVLLESRAAIAESHGLRNEGGHALLWLLPWDGATSLGWEECDPLFIEVCRRVRLSIEDGTLAGWTVSTKTRRLQAEERKGDTGDAWTPVHRTKAAALTVSGTGFNYRLVHELAFGNDYDRGVAQVLRDEDGPGAMLYTWALVRGQGKTEGLHERRVHLPAKVRARLGRSEDRDKLGLFVKARVDMAATFQKGLLKPALCALLQAGKDRLDFQDDRPKRWLNQFDHEIDRIFFDSLWADLDLSQEEADRAWAQRLFDLARRQLDEAIDSAPIPAVSRYRAVSAAQRMLFGARKKHFPDLFPPPAHEVHA